MITDLYGGQLCAVDGIHCNINGIWVQFHDFTELAYIHASGSCFGSGGKASAQLGTQHGDGSVFCGHVECSAGSVGGGGGSVNAEGQALHLAGHLRIQLLIRLQNGTSLSSKASADGVSVWVPATWLLP